MSQALITRLKSALCTPTDAALAARLGLERTAISQWRKRGAAPAWVHQIVDDPQAAFFTTLDRIEQELRLASDLAGSAFDRVTFDRFANIVGRAATGDLDLLINHIWRGRP